jgi:serine/threonine protein kinase
MSHYICKREIAKTTHYVVNHVIRSRDGADCAQKVLCSRDPVLIERFKNEARLLDSLDHPNIVKIIDKNLAGAQLFVVTPLYEKNLQEWMNHNPFVGDQTDLQKRFKIISSLLTAIEYSHRQGVIHRDIKPANVLINGDKEVVLIDFNISVCPSCDSPRVTVAGQRLGTPLYISPEQLNNGGVSDFRSDVFAVGIVIYELLGGSIGSSQIDVTLIPRRFRPFVERCTLPQTKDRYQSISDVRNVWSLLETANAKQSELNEIDALSAKSDHDPGQSHRLSHLLTEYSDDIDLVDRFLLNCDLNIIGTQFTYNPFHFRALVAKWLKFLSATQWPFSRTDSIANRCRAIFNLIQDAQIRAQIVVALFQLGSKHNRFYVFRVAGVLCESVQDSDTAEELAGLLITEFDASDMEMLREYTSFPKLHSVVRSLTHRTAREQELH